MHFVFTIGDIFLLLFLIFIVLYLAGEFLWTLITTAYKAIKDDLTDKK